jgi:hypothetical protein
LEQKLVASFNFDEGSGATSADLSGNGNTAQVVSAAWGKGVRGRGVHFDGRDGVGVRVNGSESLRSNTFTIAACINSDDSHGGMVASQGEPGANARWKLWIDGGRLRLEVWSGGGSSSVVSGHGLIPTNQWVCTSTSFDGQTARFFRDGALHSSGRFDWAGINAGATALYVGSAFGTSWFKGDIDEVRYLSYAQLDASATPTAVPTSLPTLGPGTPIRTPTPPPTTPTAGSTPIPSSTPTVPGTPTPTSPPTATRTPTPSGTPLACAGTTLAYWPLNEGSGTTARDVCHRYDGTWAQGVSWGSDGQGSYLQFAAPDGASDGPRVTVNAPALSSNTAITVEVRLMVGPGASLGRPLRVIGQQGPPGGGQARFVLDYSGNRLVVWGATGGGEFSLCGAPGSFNCIPPNTWTHVAFQIQGNQVWLYRDGRQVASGALPNPQTLRSTGAATEIGTGESIYDFDGRIQYLRISQGVRSDFLLSRP